jgi:N-acetyl-beta-hexosaminidase
LFPRLAAMAEALWSNGKNKNFRDFERRLDALMLVNKQ